MSERHANILRLHNEGRCAPRIAALLSVSRAQVYRVLSAAGRTPHPPPAYLSRAEREEVATMLRDGVGHQRIADWIGISQQRVAQIAARLGVVRKPRKRRPCDANLTSRS
jgi:DNA-directed RNA polymerase specialized sigma subunit